MNLVCPKGCHRQTWRAAGGALTYAGLGDRGQPTTKTANRVAIPPAMTRAYADMVSKLTGFGKAPTLEFYDDLHGVGGMFIPGDWAIVVGVRDIEDIAGRPAGGRGAHHRVDRDRSQGP